MSSAPEVVDTLIIGGGQSGLAVGYYLAQQGRSFVILDANERVGDAWRKRWDSLLLFTPARFDGLPGMEFPRRARSSSARTRWPTISRTTPPTSSFRFAPACELTA